MNMREFTPGKNLSNVHFAQKYLLEAAIEEAMRKHANQSNVSHDQNFAVPVCVIFHFINEHKIINWCIINPTLYQ